MKLWLLWSLSGIVVLTNCDELTGCSWQAVTNPCHPLAHPDGSDITCAVEVKNCTGEPFQCRYIGPCPLNKCGADSDPSRLQRASTSNYYRLWPTGVVPYVLSSDYDDDDREVILDAMRHWEDKTCIRFKKRTYEFYYVIFAHGSCCCSSVGRQFRPQYIILNKYSCMFFTTVVHEIGHAIGFWHEHNRPDRDEHVKVYISNARPGSAQNFNHMSHHQINSYGTPYDAISIMHYKEYAFSVNRQKTIESKHGIHLSGRELSPIDIKQARLMYRCPADPKNDPPKMVPPPAYSLPPELPDEATTCGKILSGTNGTFYTPGYPQRYPANVTCGWVIHVPEGFFVKIILKNVSLDSVNCEDSIEVHSGIPNGGSLRKRLCSSSQRHSVIFSSGRTAYVRFKTGSKIGNGTGFLASFIAEDADECRNGGYYRCRYKCINTVGSYKCICPQGLFSPSVDKYHCLDHNECMDDNGGCSHKCINTYRSYICECPHGMKLSSDKRTCLSSSDPCFHAGCQQLCLASGVIAQCSCKSGFTLNEDKMTCRDQNECNSNNGGCSHKCVNTFGSFKCKCPPRMKVTADRRTCAQRQ